MKLTVDATWLFLDDISSSNGYLLHCITVELYAYLIREKCGSSF